ncbi:MAG: MerR family transcriptional regulator [Candidatus Sericytochromatia bacterium]|nr:MerR family transcriptional regulator [Candidatus Sericytochromatia bacterium]
MRLSVAQAARELGVSVAAVREWERVLHLKFAKDRSGRRWLGPRDLENLRVVAGFVADGRTLDEVRTLLAPHSPQTETRPDLEEIVARLVQRQDAMEKLLAGQHSAMQELQGRYQQMAQAQEVVRGLLEAPAMNPDHLQALSDQVREMAEAGSGRLATLEAQLDEVRRTLDSVDESAGPEAYEALGLRLAELEEARRTEADRHAAEDAARGEALRERMYELEREVAAKTRKAVEESLMSLQRRMLDLEAALAQRGEEGQDGSLNQGGLVEGVVEALRQAEAQRRPWWRLWP